MSQAIPKRIWQTYRSRDVPQPALECIASWRERNPSWRYEFMDDDEIAQFMEDNFEPDVVAAFRMLPLGVMKADLWRYAVVWKHGGVYSDIDTLCRVPVEEWPLKGKGCIAGVADGKGIHFGQWTIAATQNHQLLRIAIDLVVERAHQGIDTSYEHFVHFYTGPMLFTDAIRRYLGADEDHVYLDRFGFPDADRRAMTARALYEARHLWEKSDVVLVDYPVLRDGVSCHFSASDRWVYLPEDSYQSWKMLRTRERGFPCP